MSSLVKGRICGEIPWGSQKQHLDLPRKVNDALRRCAGTHIPGPQRVQQGNFQASSPAPRALYGEATLGETPWTPGLTKNLSRCTRGPLLDGNQAHEGKRWILPSLKVLPLLEVSGKASHRISRHLVLPAKTCKVCSKRSEPYALLSS